jgi:tetratricopeptide (TPR) repeat protein/mono/diheme cytochrome c family protein
MKKKTKPGSSVSQPAEAAPQPRAASSSWLRWGVAIGGVALVAGAFVWWPRSQPPEAETYTPRPVGELNFNRHIAPIIHRNCAECHRPGQAAPFPLLDYAEVKRRADDIVTVTADRYMPPWLPEHGYGEFVGERRLTTEQIGMIRQWVEEGAVEGATADKPQPPTWDSEWTLGKPDLVLTLPEAYTLPAEGRDVYRNFVVPSGLDAPRFVRGVAFRPGNARVVHHAFVKIDSGGQARRQDALEAGIGFGGMNTEARIPDGQFLGWQPGRVDAFGPPGLPWRLNPGDDLVLEMHLNPSGKPEPVQPSVGLYFTDQAPTNACFKMALASLRLDIPAGEREHVVEDNFQLPVDVDALAVLPHAHYLAKEMKGWATLPDGTKKWLLFIRQWDFNWQGDYRYAAPVFLPKGSVLSMRYTYDNSTNNLRNPNHPPKDVGYGAQSSDEMAELWFQLLPRNRADLPKLEAAYQTKNAALFREAAELTLRKEPDNARARVDLGFALLRDRNLDEAERQFRAAAQSQPDYARGRYFLGLVLRQKNRVAEARAEFEAALRLDPTDGKSHGNLGFLCAEQGDLDAAQAHFQAALRLNPNDTLARDALNELLRARGGSPGR